ncbi:MAG: multicopper oxidase domain-containing protein, partial [Chloroflexi bacterium]|nr:multicopper oxidase domain-containing protein [Chloroflexota bacterium]
MMTSGREEGTRRAERSVWPVALTDALRAAFGITWVINAYLIWRPEFAIHSTSYLQHAAQGQPIWLEPWFGFWLSLVAPRPLLFVWLARLIETAIATGLLLGLARPWVYFMGAIFSLLVWSTAEGFGSPTVVSAANFGPTLIAVFFFLALAELDRAQGVTPYSLDYHLGLRWPTWRRFTEQAPRRPAPQVPPLLPWPRQAAALAVIAVVLVFVVGSLRSTLDARSVTSGAAGAPLRLVANAPGTAPRDATLPPLLDNGPTAAITIAASEATVQIASGASYQAWTFGDSVPGPTLHVREGQTVEVTFINRGHINHSLDFHAAQVSPDIAYRDVAPGQSLQFSFVASTPGVYLYHCSTEPMLMHLANGMYGAIIVDPTASLPPAEVSYVLVQSEWYTRPVQDTVMAGDFTKMQAATPDEVVF